MPDFYVFSTPDSAAFSPIITLRGTTITKSVHLGSVPTEGKSPHFRRSVAALQKLDGAPALDQLLVRGGGVVGVAPRQCRQARRYQSG